jgi:hypothetical protein
VVGVVGVVGVVRLRETDPTSHGIRFRDIVTSNGV